VHSTKSIIVFVLIMTSLVALVLSGMSTFLKPIHDKNEALYAKKAILSAVANHIDGDFGSLTEEDIQGIFDSQINQSVIDMSGNGLDADAVEALGYIGGQAENVDMAKEQKKDEADRILPVFVFEKSDGSKYYILSTRGKGLWDAIWGNIALEEDLSTIAGVAFDHKSETPGLGAEIKDNSAFKKQFIGKKIFNDAGEYTSIFVRKGGAKDPVHEVDGISGATITADGVTEMLQRGLRYYEPYFNSIKG